MRDRSWKLEAGSHSNSGEFALHAAPHTIPEARVGRLPAGSPFFLRLTPHEDS
jgi:hypothetical protein